MRAALIAASCGLALCLAGAAQAQSSNRLVIDVKPRSWLDPGKNPPPRSMHNYVYDLQSSAAADIARFGARSGPQRERFPVSQGIPITTPNFFFLD